ncbi:hypothetical protein MACK_000405 [Theileria orientalis]|uniref:Chorein N-terminal domain-containing protein n=1 Tax=Theileria orientalis TaxID=68886 RepID=A0A976MBG8_THEOR|nr:hypothetical protein MACK_000405 [Theileria orientalis]
MFEEKIIQLLNKVFDSYIEGIDQSKLSQINLWGGKIVLNSLHIRPDALDFLELPFHLTFGLLDSVTIKIQIPLLTLSRKNLSLEVSDVLLLLTTKPESRWDPEWYRDEYISNKIATLSAESLELVVNQLEGNGFVWSTALSFLETLEVTIHNIHIRVEDYTTNDNVAYAFGCVVKNAYFKLNLDNTKETSVDLPFQKLFADNGNLPSSIKHRTIDLEGFGLYIDQLDPFSRVKTSFPYGTVDLGLNDPKDNVNKQGRKSTDKKYFSRVRKSFRSARRRRFLSKMYSRVSEAQNILTTILKGGREDSGEEKDRKTFIEHTNGMYNKVFSDVLNYLVTSKHDDCCSHSTEAAPDDGAFNSTVWEKSNVSANEQNINYVNKYQRRTSKIRTSGAFKTAYILNGQRRRQVGTSFKSKRSEDKYLLSSEFFQTNPDRSDSSDSGEQETDENIEYNKNKRKSKEENEDDVNKRRKNKGKDKENSKDGDEDEDPGDPKLNRVYVSSSWREYLKLFCDVRGNDRRMTKSSAEIINASLRRRNSNKFIDIINRESCDGSKNEDSGRNNKYNKNNAVGDNNEELGSNTGQFETKFDENTGERSSEDMNIKLDLAFSQKIRQVSEGRECKETEEFLKNEYLSSRSGNTYDYDIVVDGVDDILDEFERRRLDTDDLSPMDHWKKGLGRLGSGDSSSKAYSTSDFNNEENESEYLKRADTPKTGDDLKRSDTPVPSEQAQRGWDPGKLSEKVQIPETMRTDETTNTPNTPKTPKTPKNREKKAESEKYDQNNEGKEDEGFETAKNGDLDMDSYESISGYSSSSFTGSENNLDRTLNFECKLSGTPKSLKTPTTADTYGKEASEEDNDAWTCITYVLREGCRGKLTSFVEGLKKVDHNYILNTRDFRGLGSFYFCTYPILPSKKYSSCWSEWGSKYGRVALSKNEYLPKCSIFLVFEDLDVIMSKEQIECIINLINHNVFKFSYWMSGVVSTFENARASEEDEKMYMEYWPQFLMSNPSLEGESPAVDPKGSDERIETAASEISQIIIDAYENDSEEEDGSSEKSATHITRKELTQFVSDFEILHSIQTIRILRNRANDSLNKLIRGFQAGTQSMRMGSNVNECITNVLFTNICSSYDAKESIHAGLVSSKVQERLQFVGGIYEIVSKQTNRSGMISSLKKLYTEQTFTVDLALDFMFINSKVILTNNMHTSTDETDIKGYILCSNGLHIFYQDTYGRDGSRFIEFEAAPFTIFSLDITLPKGRYLRTENMGDDDTLTVVYREDHKRRSGEAGSKMKRSCICDMVSGTPCILMSCGDCTTDPLKKNKKNLLSLLWGDDEDNCLLPSVLYFSSDYNHFRIPETSDVKIRLHLDSEIFIHLPIIDELSHILRIYKYNMDKHSSTFPIKIDDKLKRLEYLAKEDSVVYELVDLGVDYQRKILQGSITYLNYDVNIELSKGLFLMFDVNLKGSYFTYKIALDLLKIKTLTRNYEEDEEGSYTRDTLDSEAVSDMTEELLYSDGLQEGTCFQTINTLKAIHSSGQPEQSGFNPMSCLSPSVKGTDGGEDLGVDKSNGVTVEGMAVESVDVADGNGPSANGGDNNESTDNGKSIDNVTRRLDSGKSIDSDNELDEANEHFQSFSSCEDVEQKYDMGTQLDTDGYDLHECVVSGFTFDCLNGMCELKERSVYMGKNCRISLNNYLKSVLRIKTKYLDRVEGMGEFMKLFENSVNLLSTDREVKVVVKTLTNMVKQNHPNLIVSVDTGSMYVTLRDVDMVGLICSLSDYKQIILKYAIKLDVVSEHDIKRNDASINVHQNKYHSNKYIRKLKKGENGGSNEGKVYFDEFMLKAYFNWNLLQESKTGERTEGFIKYEMNLDFFNLTFKRLISFNTKNSYYTNWNGSSAVNEGAANSGNMNANFGYGSSNMGSGSYPCSSNIGAGAAADGSVIGNTSTIGVNNSLIAGSNQNTATNPGGSTGNVASTASGAVDGSVTSNSNAIGKERHDAMGRSDVNSGNMNTINSISRRLESKFKSLSRDGSSKFGSGSYSFNNYVHGYDLNKLEEYVKFYGISTPLLSLKVTGFGIKVGILDSKIERICSYLGSVEVEDQSNCVPLYASTLFSGGNTTMLWSWLKVRREYDQYRMDTERLGMESSRRKGGSGKGSGTVSGKIYGYYKRVQRYIDATMNFDAHSHNHIYNADDQENLDHIVESIMKMNVHSGEEVLREVDLREMYLIDTKSYASSSTSPRNHQSNTSMEDESYNNSSSMSQLLQQYRDDYTNHSSNLEMDNQTLVSSSENSGQRILQGGDAGEVIQGISAAELWYSSNAGQRMAQANENKQQSADKATNIGQEYSSNLNQVTHNPTVKLPTGQKGGDKDIGVVGMVFGGCPCFVSLSLISGTTRSCSIYVSSSIVTLPWEVIESVTTYFNSINAYIKDNIKQSDARENEDMYKDDDEYKDDLDSTDAGSQSGLDEVYRDESSGREWTSKHARKRDSDDGSNEYSLDETDSVSDSADVGEDDSTLVGRLSAEGTNTPTDFGREEEEDVMNRQFYRTPEEPDKKFSFNVHVGISCMNLFTESAWTGYGYFLKYVYHKTVPSDKMMNLKWNLIRNILRDKNRKAYMIYPITLNITGQGSLYLTHTRVSDDITRRSYVRYTSGRYGTMNSGRYGTINSARYGTMNSGRYGVESGLDRRKSSKFRYGNVYRRTKFDMYCKDSIEQMFEGWFHFMPCVFEVKLMSRNVSVKLTREASGAILTPSGYTMCDLYLDISSDFRHKRANFIKYMKMSLLMDKRYYALVNLAKNSLYDPTNLNTSKIVDPFRSNLSAVFYLYGNDRNMWATQIMPQSVSVHLKLEPLNVSINCIDFFCLMDFSNLLLSFFELFKQNYTLILHASDEFLEACKGDYTTLEKIRITKLFSKMETGLKAEEMKSSSYSEYSSCVSSRESSYTNQNSNGSVRTSGVKLTELEEQGGYQSDDEYSCESGSNYQRNKTEEDMYETISEFHSYYDSGVQEPYSGEARYLDKEEAMSSSSAEYEDADGQSLLTRILSTISVGVSVDLELINVEIMSSVTSEVKHMFALTIEDTGLWFWVNNIFDCEYLDAKSKIPSLEFGEEGTHGTTWFNDPLLHKDPSHYHIGDVDYENVAYLEQFSGVLRGGVLEMSASSLSQAMKYKADTITDTQVIIDELKESKNIIIRESNFPREAQGKLNEKYKEQKGLPDHNDVAGPDPATSNIPKGGLAKSDVGVVTKGNMGSLNKTGVPAVDLAKYKVDAKQPGPNPQVRTGFTPLNQLTTAMSNQNRDRDTEFTTKRVHSGYSIHSTEDKNDVVILINDEYTRNNVRYSIVSKNQNVQKVENLIGVQTEDENNSIGLENILHVDEMIDVEKIPSIASFNKFLGASSDDMELDENYYENRQLDQCYRENVKNFIQFRFKTSITIDLCREGNREMAVETFTVSLMGYKPSLATKLFSRLESSWINVNVTLNAAECYFGFLSYVSVMLKLRKMLLHYAIEEAKILDSVTKYTINDQVPRLSGKVFEQPTDQIQIRTSKEYGDSHGLGMISKDLSEYTLSKLSRDSRSSKDTRLSKMFMDTKLSKLSVHSEVDPADVYSMPINNVSKEMFAKCITYRYFNGLLQPCGVMNVNELIEERLKAVSELKFLGIKKIDPLYQSYLKFETKELGAKSAQGDLKEDFTQYKTDQDIYNAPIEHNVVHVGKLGHANVFGTDNAASIHSKLHNNLGQPIAVAMKGAQASHGPSIQQLVTMNTSTTSTANDFMERSNVDTNPLREAGVLSEDSYTWLVLKDGASCELPVGHYGILEPFLVRVKIGNYEYEITSNQLDLSYNDNQLMFKLDLNPKDDLGQYGVDSGFEEANETKESSTEGFGVVRFAKEYMKRLMGRKELEKTYNNAYLMVNIEQKTVMQSSSTSSSSINIYFTSGLSVTNKSREVVVVFPTARPPENRTLSKLDLLRMDLQTPSVSDLVFTKGHFRESRMTDLDKLFKPISVLTDHKLVKKIEPRRSRSRSSAFGSGDLSYTTNSRKTSLNRESSAQHVQSEAQGKPATTTTAKSANSNPHTLNNQPVIASNNQPVISVNKQPATSVNKLADKQNSCINESYSSTHVSTGELQYIVLRGGADNPEKATIPLPWIVDGNNTICVALLSDFAVSTELNEINEETEQTEFGTEISCDVLLSRESSLHIVSSFEGQRIKVPVPGFVPTLHLGKLKRGFEREGGYNLEYVTREAVETKNQSQENDYAMTLSCTLNEFTSVHKTQIPLNPMKHCLKQYELILEPCQIIENMMPYDINILSPKLYAILNTQKTENERQSENVQRAISFDNIADEQSDEENVRPLSRSLSISTPQLVQEELKDKIIDLKAGLVDVKHEDDEVLSIKSGTSMHLDKYMTRAIIFFKDFCSHEFLFKKETTNTTLVFEKVTGVLLENAETKFNVEPRPQSSYMPTKITVSVEIFKRSTQPSKDKEGIIKRCLASSQIVCSIYADKWAVNWLGYPILLSRSDARYIQCFGGNGCSVVSQDLSNTGLHMVIRKNNLKKIHAYDMYKKKEKGWSLFRLTSPSHLISNKFVVPELTFSSCSIRDVPNYPNLHYLVSTSIAPMPFFRTVVMEILPQVTITNDFDLDIWIREYFKSKSVVKTVIKKTGIFSKLNNKVKLWLHRRVTTTKDDEEHMKMSARMALGKYSRSVNRMKSAKSQHYSNRKSTFNEERGGSGDTANWIKVSSGMTVEFHPQSKGEFYLQVTAISPADFQNLKNIKFWSCSLLIKPSSSTQFRYPESIKYTPSMMSSDLTEVVLPRPEGSSLSKTNSYVTSNEINAAMMSDRTSVMTSMDNLSATGFPPSVRNTGATIMGVVNTGAANTFAINTGAANKTSLVNAGPINTSLVNTGAINNGLDAETRTAGELTGTAMSTTYISGDELTAREVTISAVSSSSSSVTANDVTPTATATNTAATTTPVMRPATATSPMLGSGIVQGGFRYSGETGRKLSQADIVKYGLCEVETLVHKGCKMVRFLRPMSPEWMIINATGFNLYIQQLGILSHGEILERNSTLKELNTTRVNTMKDLNNRDYIDLEFQNGVEYGWYDPQKEQKLIIKLYHLQDKNNDVLAKYASKANVNPRGEKLFVKVKGALLIDLGKVESINTTNMFNIKMGQMRLMAKLNAQTSVVMGQRTLILTCGKLNKLLARNKKLFDIYKQIKIKIPNTEEQFNSRKYLLNKFKYNLKNVEGIRVSARRTNNTYPFSGGLANRFLNNRSSRDTERMTTKMLYLRNTALSRVRSTSPSTKQSAMLKRHTYPLPDKYRPANVAREKEVVINISNDYTFNISLNGLGVCVCSYLPNELLYVSLVLVQFNTSFQDNESRYEFSVGWLQSDVHDIESYFPTMVKPVINYSPFNIGSINKKKASSYVHHDIITNSNKQVINIVMNTKSNRYIKEISLLSIDIQPININLDTRIIFSTLLLLDDYLSVFSQSERSMEAFSAPHVGIFNYENMQSFDDEVYTLSDVVRSQYGADASKGARYNISRLIIGKIVMVINIRRSEALQMEELPLLSPTVRYLVYIVRRTPHISDAHIVLNKESLLRLCCTPYVLLSHFGSRYVSQAIHQIYKVLWAVDLIGNPKMIFNHWFSALYQSLIDFREALRFVHLPPVTFLLLLKGISQFGISVLSGIVDAFYRFTGSWCILLNAMALNSDRYAVFLLNEVFPKNFGHPSNVFEGLYFGTMMMGRNLYISLGNFVFKPVNSFNKFLESIRLRNGNKDVLMSFVHIWSSLFSSLLSLLFGSFSSALSGLSITLQGLLNQMHSVPMLSAIRPRRSLQHLKSTGPIRYNFLESWSMEASKRIGHTNQVLLVLPLDVKLKLFDPVYLATSHWSVLATHISSISPLILSQSFGNFKDLIWIDRLKVGYVEKGRIKWRYDIKSVNRIQLIELNAELSCRGTDEFDIEEVNETEGFDPENTSDNRNGTDDFENSNINDANTNDDDVRVVIYDSHFCEKKVHNRKLKVVLPLKSGKKLLGKRMYFMRILFSEPGEGGQFKWTEKKKIPLKLQMTLQNPYFLQDDASNKISKMKGGLSHRERQIHKQIHENLGGIARRLNQLSISTHRNNKGEMKLEPVRRYGDLYDIKELIDINNYVKTLDKVKYTNIDEGERTEMIKRKRDSENKSKREEKEENKKEGKEDNSKVSELNEEEQYIYDKFNSIISDYTDKPAIGKRNSENNRQKGHKSERTNIHNEMLENEEEEWVEIIKMPNLETGKLYFTLLTSVIREVAL